MNKSFTTLKKLGSLLILTLAMLLSVNNTYASHVVGGDVEYECTGPRTWKIRLIIYRDCTGATLCSSMGCTQSVIAKPNTTLNPAGCTATPNQVSATLSLVKVEDVGKANVELCGNSAKNGCHNLNQVTPGPYSPSVEKYVFEGTLNLNYPSLNNSNCTYWDVYWTLCCRNANIWNLAGSSGQDFRIGATINIFNRSLAACKNKSPILKNEPVATLCSGQEYVFNMGAVDPDDDSLTYEIAPSLQSGGNPVNYQPPGGANYPFPLNSTKVPHINFPQPNGPYVIIDSINGDISFNALNNTAGYIYGNLNVRIKQWSYDDNGNPVLVGITQRDLQLYVFNCPGNNPPRFATIPSGDNNRPKYDYDICAGELLCFTIIAKDTDVYPAIQRFDTTYMSWNEGIVRPGKLNFAPTYAVGPGMPRPREDSWQFCWQTEDSDGRTLPYYFTVTAADKFCPNVGRVTRAFSIKVMPTPKADGRQQDLKCGKWEYKVRKTDVKQTFASASMKIALQPFDYNFSNGFRTLGSPNLNPGPNPTGPITDPRPIIVDTFTYVKGGKYLVQFTVSTPGPLPGLPCTKTYTDTIVVDTPAVAFVSDTFTCKGTPINLKGSAKFGTPPYTFSWYRNAKTGSPVKGPLQVNGNNYDAADIVTTKYVLEVRDLKGCTALDSMTLEVKKLPVPLFSPDSARICAGESFTLDPGNNDSNLTKYNWFKNGAFQPDDTTQTVVKKDSALYSVLMTDVFGCKMRDTFDLRVNLPLVVNAGMDTAVCPKDTVKLTVSGGYKYKWDIIQGPVLFNVQPKGYRNTFLAAPSLTTDYVVTAYYSYPDTTKSYLECSNRDTVRVVARPLPNLSPTQPQNLCKSEKELVLPFRLVTPANQQGGTGGWTFRAAPGALSVQGTTTLLRVDSLPSLPKDTFYATMQTQLAGASNSYYMKYSYRGPVAQGACLREDSTLVRVFALPKINAGSDTSVCINAQNLYSLKALNHYHYPEDPSGKAGIWSVPQGGGLVTTVENALVTSYAFNPKLPGVNVQPNTNTLKYTYTINYTLPPPSFGTKSCVNADSIIMRVVPTPVVEAGTDFAICKNEPVFAIAAKSGATTNTTIPGSTYWTFAPGQTPNNMNDAIVSKLSFDGLNPVVPINGGVWKLYYTDEATGCMARDSVNMEVIKLPVVDISYAFAGTNDSICKTASSIQFKGDATPLGGTGSYAGIGVSTAGFFDVQDAAVIPQNYYTAYYNYSITKLGTTCTGYDSIITFVQQPPTINVPTVPAKCAYDTDPFNLTATVNPSFYGIKWVHDGAGSLDNDTSLTPKYTFNKPTDTDRQFLFVTANTTNNGVCNSVSAAIRLDINPKPNPAFTCDSCVGCAPLTSYLAADGAGVGNSTYNWYVMNGTNEIPFAPNDSAIVSNLTTHGKRLIKLKATTPAGCVAESFDSITVYAVPNASFYHNPEVTTIAKPEFDFYNTSTVADNQTMLYKWNFGADPNYTGTGTAPDRIITDKDPQKIPFGSIGKFLVYLDVTTQPGGCFDTAMGEPQIDPDITVFIPSAFRPVPNANSAPCADPTIPGCNEKFYVYADGFKTIEVYVFNRWGEQVFSTINPNIGWNGKVNNSGAECPQDVYIYQVNATSFNDKKYTYSGSITLLR
ncbi:MAG: gliding motility-associated C-terminal domain-containing protein [Bacteroidia bacterium]|nr:gliding motility-associated C-terminal domain-containing protein [Bacteroidia bacterium]